LKHKYKLKIFGPTTTNFYGWIFTGILIFGLSFYLFGSMWKSNDILSVFKFGFASIILLLLGIFGVILQNYHSGVSKYLYENDNEKE